MIWTRSFNVGADFLAAEHWDKIDAEFALNEGGWIFERCLHMCAISPSSALLHRSVFDNIGWFDESLLVNDPDGYESRESSEFLPVLLSQLPLGDH